MNATGEYLVSFEFCLGNGGFVMDEVTVVGKESDVKESRLLSRNLARELSSEELDFITGAVLSNPKGCGSSACSSDNQSCDLDWHSETAAY